YRWFSHPDGLDDSRRNTRLFRKFRVPPELEVSLPILPNHDDRQFRDVTGEAALKPAVVPEKPRSVSEDRTLEPGSERATEATAGPGRERVDDPALLGIERFGVDRRQARHAHLVRALFERFL